MRTITENNPVISDGRACRDRRRGEPRHPDQGFRHDTHEVLSGRTPISDSTVPLLEVPDVPRDARKVPDASVGRVLLAMTKRLTEFTSAERSRLRRSAPDYYNPGTRALLGMLPRCEAEALPAFGTLLNPTTRFDPGVDGDDWPEAQAWNVR